MPYKIKITLPVSKKEVVLQMPEWRVQEEVNRYTKANNLDGNGATMFLMTKVVIQDGQKVTNPDDFQSWPYKDYMHAVDCFNEWKGEPVDEVENVIPVDPRKNELPTGM